MTAYDRLTADPHPNDRDEIGTEDGEPCGRYHEPGLGARRGYRPEPCKGLMKLEQCGCRTWCSVCGEYA